MPSSLPAHLELLVGVQALGVLLDVVHHAVAYGVREGGLFAPQDLRRQPVALKGLAQQVLALAVAVQLLFRVDGHDVAHKIQVAKGHAGFDAVGGDAAVCAQHIVHIQLADALLALLLESIGGGGVVGVLVAEQLVRDLAGQQHADVGLLVDGLADSRYIPMLARMVVISQVPSSRMTSSRLLSTISRLMMISWCSLPR